MTRTSITALAFLFFMGCQSPIATQAKQNDEDSLHVRKVTLKTYKAPAGRQDELNAILRQFSYPITVNSEQGAQTQFVKLSNAIFTSDGSFSISAPKEIHDGIPAVIEAISRSEPSASHSVRVNYWIVTGEPSAETSFGSRLGAIQSVTETISENTGPMTFKLYETLQLTGIEDTAVDGKTSLSQIRQTVSIEDKRIILDLECHILEARYQTQLRLQEGQYAVLGQIGLGQGSIFDKEKFKNRTMFLVAKVDIID